MSRKFVFITFPVILLVAIYFMGPEPESPKWNNAMPVVPQDPRSLEDYIKTGESQHKLKIDNEARVIWADSTKKKTPYSVVYLHGFSASQGEGDPVHREFAKTFGCNLYLSRLADHGVDTTEQLLYLTPARLWTSAREALAIGKAIGEKVIIMSTSTGGTLALMLAAEYPDDVFALINMSPNIAINDPLAFVANNPWGVQIARTVFGGNYNIAKPRPGADTLMDNRYWNKKYRLEAVAQLQELLESKMTSSEFRKVKAPCLTLYYFRDEEHQDPQVKVSAMLEMNEEISTPPAMKETIAIPNADAHVIGSKYSSKDVASVFAAVKKFAIEKLGMNPVGE
jgi:pimeloyl-ACP methyl ester carboxylesterase